MNIQENGIVTPYAIRLEDIENNRNVDFETFLYACQINADSGQQQLKDKSLLVAMNWNCCIKFKGFYLPVVLRVYMHDHLMEFEDKKNDFSYIVSAVRNSFYKMKALWQKEMKGTAIQNLIKDADEAEVAQIANDILLKAEYYGYYD